MIEITREIGEALIIGDNIKVFISNVKGQQVKLGVYAPRAMAVNREEVHKRIQAEKNGNK